MFYFPLFSGVFPNWVPLVGGTDFQFFRPVFNVADSAISIGIFSIIIFFRKQFNNLDKKGEEETATKQIPEETQQIDSENESQETTTGNLSHTNEI